MEELKRQIEELLQSVSEIFNKLNLPDKQAKLQVLKEQMSAPDFWSDPNQAALISKQAGNLEQEIIAWQDLFKKTQDLIILAKDSQADFLQVDLEKNLVALQVEFARLSEVRFLSGQYDQSPVIINIFAGAGGVDAQDWAEMLERMYLRFAEQNSYTVKYLSRSAGNEAGIKSATFKISGPYAFGYFKNEAGVHRLVRLSEYDADHARHTSFAMVEVLPEIEGTAVKLNSADLKVETYRSSGHGGQSVNTTDSAVRITHLPTGIVAMCQNERSQLQNKNQALAYLASKVQKYYDTQQEAERQALKGEYTEAAWGNQIRSYVLHPYKMVKDHRTNHESSDPNKVLAGDLWPFIKANLHSQ
ncbi:MAG: peptide chain release factor 2 [Patescibacteria group bacterium]